MRWLSIAAIAFLVSGCALPPAVTIASLALDVGSYYVSGKTMTDHGLSFVMDEDCALIRLLEGDPCDEIAEFEPAVATLEPLPGSEPGTQLAAVEDASTGDDAATVAADIGLSWEQTIEAVLGLHYLTDAAHPLVRAPRDPLAGSGFIADGARPAPPFV